MNRFWLLAMAFGSIMPLVLISQPVFSDSPLNHCTPFGVTLANEPLFKCHNGVPQSGQHVLFTNPIPEAQEKIDLVLGVCEFFVIVVNPPDDHGVSKVMMVKIGEPESPNPHCAKISGQVHLSIIPAKPSE